MAITFTKPTVGASTDTWGTTLNGIIDEIADYLDGTTAITPDLTAGSWSVSGTAITSTAADLNKIASVTSSAAELNLLNGSVANTVVNNKAVVYGSAGQVQATTVDLGDWTVTESGGVLYFATGGVNKMKIDASGNLTVVGNVTAYGTV
jgi:hypothetical protein